jgi:hypothetical protein
MTPSELSEFLEVLKTHNALQAKIDIGAGESISVVFGVEMPAEPIPKGQTPTPGGWKGTQGLDLPFESELP